MVDQERLRQLVDEGASLARIAAELGVGRSAVRAALARAGLKTARSTTLAAAQEARAQGGKRLKRECGTHGVVLPAPDTRGTFRCTRCSTDAVARRRRKVKEAL